MSAATPPPEPFAISVHPLPESEFRRMFHLLFALFAFGCIVTAVVFVLFGCYVVAEDEPMRPLFLYGVPAVQVVGLLPGYFIWRFTLRRKWSKTVYYTVSADCLQRVFPPLLSRRIQRTDVARVEEWSPHGPLVLRSKNGRTFKVPGDIERYDQIRRTLLGWC